MRKKRTTRFFYSINFYKSVSDWKKFSAQVDKYIERNGSSVENSINEWSWDVYEKANDPEIVVKAIGWMKPVIESLPKYYSIDTYASLLYKAKKWNEAETFAMKAIELGKKEGEKTQSTEDLLEKIRKEKK